MDRLRDLRHFSGAGMNLDDDARLLKANEHREIWNSIIGVSESSHVACLQNIKGTVSVFDKAINTGFDVPEGLLAVGACDDISENAVIFFLADTLGDTNHSILRIYLSDYRCEWILKSESLLNFKTDYPVTANRIGDLLYWTDGYFNTFLNSDFNPPRKINILKAIKYTAAKEAAWVFTAVSSGSTSDQTYYVGSEPPPFAVGDHVVPFALDGINRYKNSTGYCTVLSMAYTSGVGHLVYTDRPWQEAPDTPAKVISGTIIPYDTDMYFGVDWQVIDRIKHPPAYGPTASYNSDTTVSSNLLRNNLFQFCYRWIYDDNEKSVFSPKSEIPIPTVMGLLNGSYQDDQTIDNDIIVWFDSGPMEVKTIELAVRLGNEGAWSIVKRKNKYDENVNVEFSSDIYLRYDFYNTETFEGLDQEDVGRPFDYVPIVSKHQELFEKNRLGDGNYLEGFNNVKIDAMLSNTQTVAEIGGVNGILTSWVSNKILGKYIGNEYSLAFYGGWIDFTAFYETGYTYVISIDASPYKYENIENTPSTPAFTAVIWGDFYNKKIISQATVVATPGMTWEDFSNSVVAQLRNGNYMDSSVLAMNEFAYQSYTGNTLFSGFTYQSPAGFYPFPPGNHTIGFLLEFSEGDWNRPCVSCSAVSVRIIKLANMTTEPTFKSGCAHPMGVFYMDRAKRFAPVCISDGTTLRIPSQNNSVHGLYKNTIGWEINSIPPDWADYYIWAYAKNTSMIMSLYATISKIEVVNATNSVFICINEYLIDQHEAIKKFSLSSYTWEPGDRIRFIANSEDNVYSTMGSGLDFEIIGVLDPTDDLTGDTYKRNDLGEHIKDADGNKIKDPRQVGILVNYFNYNYYQVSIDNTIVEIYRPKKSTDDIIYYEFGSVMPILDPHTVQRRHGPGNNGNAQVVVNGTSTAPATGTFTKGDSFLRYRSMHNVFPCESFSYSDYFESEVIDIGGPNIVNKNIRSQWFTSNIRYGGLYIENTQVNELSKFLYKDLLQLPEKFGPINYIAEVGFTIKVLQKNKPSSIYVGRQGLTQADTERGEVLYASDNTLGTVTSSSSNYGTEHPESCVRHERNLYYYDINSGCIVRDSGNGVRSISQPEEGDNDSPYKIKNYLQAKSRTFRSHDVTVYGAYDGRYDIVYFCFVDATTPAESFTIGFHEPSNRWVSFYSFIPEFITGMNQTVFSWKDGEAWLHNEGARMNFYGVQYEQSVKTVSNTNPLVKKRFLSLTENSNKVWHLGDQGDVYIPPDETYTRGQTSLVKAGAFSDLEGTIYAAFGKNMTTNQIEPSNDDYLNGDDMRGNHIELTLHNESTDETNLFSIEVDSIASNP